MQIESKENREAPIPKADTELEVVFCYSRSPPFLLSLISPLSASIFASSLMIATTM
jgi:hypothetical protein